MKTKRLIAETDEQTFKDFKDKCRAMGATMSEVILLGLESGLEIYAAKEIKKLELKQKQIQSFCKNFKFKGDPLE